MTSQNVVNPSPAGLIEAAQQANSKGLPPVHLWNPPYCGDLDIRIAADGRWFHEGGEIRRPEMVKLFSSILKLEDGAYFLVTPVEKVGITVEDAPFVAVDMVAEGEGHAQSLRFETQVGDTVVADVDHPIRVATDPETGAPSPYIMVRAGLEARIDRKTFYRMVEKGAEKDGWFGVHSAGAFFRLIKSEDL